MNILDHLDKCTAINEVEPTLEDAVNALNLIGLTNHQESIDVKRYKIFDEKTNKVTTIIRVESKV